MKHLILGTAGHIDHGKTALVRLLTGTDCDRLPEEKARGITIELGFAGLDLPDGTHLGIVDVPGHERFVHHMVAGAAGIDVILLVVAADEGVMPQTREHFDICRLLGVRTGLVALTKSDLVDADLLELALADVEDFVKGSFLEGAAIVPVSSTTGAGREALIEALSAAASTVAPKRAGDLLRLPIDRVFTMKGFGTVVTGTLVSGAVNVGDAAAVEPGGPRARVRGLQVHGRSVERAEAGRRTALNFQNVSLDELRRGQVVVAPNTLETVSILDARVQWLPTAPRPLKRRARIRFHALTDEIAGRVYPLSVEEVAPGGNALVQIRLESPAVVLPGDRFVLRSWSPSLTVGGGVVVNTRARKYRRPLDAVLADLHALESAPLDERLRVLYRRADKDGVAFATLRGLTGASEKELAAIYQRLLSQGEIQRIDPGEDRAVHREVAERLGADILARLDACHAERPDAAGLTRGELADRALYGVSARFLAKSLTALEKAGEIEFEGDHVRRRGFRPGFAGGALAVLTETVATALRDAGAAPPTIKDLRDATAAKPADLDKALALLVRDSRAVRVNATLFYDREALDAVLAGIRRRLDETGEIDAQSFKDLTGLSRKFAIPLLEYCDAIKLTLRVGDKRVRRGGGS